MASGKEHDHGILITTFIVGGLTYYITNNPPTSFFITAGHLIGGLFLSPDLDLRSLPYYRWGTIRWIWKPYQNAIPHRGWFFNRNFLSHAPIIGTVGRVVYLGAIIYLLVLTADSFAKTNYLSALLAVVKKNQLSLIYLLVGVEVSAWVHLCMDIAATNMSRSRSYR